MLNQNQSWNLGLEGVWNSTTVNGITENRTFNQVYEILTSNNNPLTHDRKGNLTQNKDSSQYTWDYNNQLSHSINASSESSSYTYDALGRKISKQVNGTLTVYINIGYQIATEYQSTDGINFNEKQSYVYATYIDDPLVLVKASGERFYYHSNGQFSISKITDEYKNVVETYAYNAYGDVQILQNYPGLDNPYYFTGRQLDQETGIFYFRARYYDAKLGQFISRDPIGYVDGMNLYRGYFFPNKKDPNGLNEVTLISPYATAGDWGLWSRYGWWKNFWGGDYSQFRIPTPIDPEGKPLDPTQETADILKKSQSDCISVLNISGHGAPGSGVTTTTRTINGDMYFGTGITENSDGLADLGSTVCSDGVINLCSCSSAANISTLQTFANNANRKVCACDGNVSSRCTCSGRWICRSPNGQEGSNGSSTQNEMTPMKKK